jgi:predicted nuclease of predicted toxin-antitoxin system
MRFKIDENLPIEIAELLISSGHDAMTVFDQKLVGEPDSKVADICRAENRALVTLDLDFSDIRTFPPAAYAGFIILRPNNQSKTTVLALMKRVIPLLNGVEKLTGNLWIAQENGLRIREG